LRKLALAAVAAASVGAVAVAVPAFAVDADQGLSVAVSPSKAGTKKKPKAVKVKVTTTTTPQNGASNFSTRQAVIHFDKNLVFNGAKFKSCTFDQLQAAEANCPKGSKVGSGSAVGQAFGQKVNLTVTAFNGPKGKSLLLHVVGSGVASIDSVMNAKLKSDKGKYGKKLVVPIPDNLQQPIKGVYATLLSFITKVGATSKGVPYVGLTGCSGGKLNFAGDFTFTDGDMKSATATAPCKK
jgi:hypothetical protein